MTSRHANKGKQGFASMDDEKQREIASKGGRTKHKGEPPEDQATDADRRQDSEDDEDDQDDEAGNNRRANKGKQGFASMDPEKQREIASKGGRSSHRGDSDEGSDEEFDEEEDSSEVEAFDEGEELDELLNLLQESELADLDPQEGIELIDEWYDIVNDSGDTELKEVAKGLKQLKKVLSASKSKPADIAEALSQLGEQTDEYANQAPRGYKTKLHQLGKSLNQAGRSLEQDAE